MMFRELNCPNEIVFFEDGVGAIEYLRRDTVNPFLIISDVNLPRMTGFELKKAIQEDEVLRKKGVPYIFCSTGAPKSAVELAYELSAQGFFRKAGNYDRMKNTLRIMIEYWTECYSPSGYTRDMDDY
jgi:CheY-like chemotaxis protein